MRVAVIHYHLRPGGVTRVIERALAAAGNTGNFVVLSGGPPAPDFGFKDKVRVVPGLGYDDGGKPRVRPDTLLASLRSTAKNALGGVPDLWHFHNHSLGKNRALTAAIPLVAEQGKILLQIHDFAEDGRPALFQALLRDVGNGDISRLGRNLYPQCDNVHYAVLNGRDRDLLAAAGIPQCRLHLLPNPVVLPSDPDPARDNGAIEKDRLFLYCTRAIRRKNMGEFLFWAALSERGDRFAVTLAPENPAELPFYERWVKVAGELSLPVEFELGPRSGMSLVRLLERSFAAVTTSVAEGFGLAFLESWLVDRPVFGRGLPEITREFEEAGVDLSHLYDRLPVPLDKTDQDILLRKIRERLDAVHAEYGRSVPSGAAETALAAAMRDDRVDFARLDGELQEKVIKKISGSKSFRNELIPRDLMTEAVRRRITESNKAAIRRNFSLSKYGSRLMEIYQATSGSEIKAQSERFDIKKLLDEFLAPERFFLLRS